MTIRFRSNEHFFFFFFFFFSVGKGSVFRHQDHPLWGRKTPLPPLRIIDSIALFPVRHVSKCVIIEKIGLIERLEISIFPRIFPIFRRIRRGRLPVNCFEKERLFDRRRRKKPRFHRRSEIIFRQKKV